MEIEVVTQPRVDLLVRRADTGADARRVHAFHVSVLGDG